MPNKQPLPMLNKTPFSNHPVPCNVNFKHRLSCLNGKSSMVSGIPIIYTASCFISESGLNPLSLSLSLCLIIAISEKLPYTLCKFNLCTLYLINFTRTHCTHTLSPSVCLSLSSFHISGQTFLPTHTILLVSNSL